MACQGSAPPARPGLGPRDGGQWPSLLGMPRAAYLFPPCCPAQVRAHPRTSAQRGMSFLTGVPVPTPPLPETWQGCRWSGAGLLQHADLRRRPSCTVGPPVACLAHYPLHTSSWGGRFPSPSVRTKYLTRLASVPSRGGGRGKNRCLTVKRPLCTSLTPPPRPHPRPRPPLSPDGLPWASALILDYEQFPLGTGILTSGPLPVLFLLPEICFSALSSPLSTLP